MVVRILFLLLISITSFSQGSRNFFVLGSGSTAPPLQSELSFYDYGATDQMLVYVPAEAEPAGGWPVVFWYHGNSERGNPSITFDNIGTGNGSQTVFSGSLTNSTANILHTSVIVKVNGVDVATGRNGIITGTGVTGTYDVDDETSAAYSVTFTTPPPNTHIVRMDYTESDLCSRSYPMILNSGDEPSGVMVVCPQISRGTGGFDEVTEWDDVITVLDANFTVNHDKFYVTGLSLGADMCHTILTNRNTEFAAYIAAANGSGANIPSSGNALWTATEKRGKLYVQGSADGTGVITAPTTMANANANNTTAIFPVESTLYWNLGHGSSLWDNKVFDRLNRTDQAGLAPFDFIDWFKRFSLDDEDQATLLVTYAEGTVDISDYRIAAKMVATLAGGAPKTALEGRLTTLKTSVGAWIHTDIGTAFRNTTSDANFNNVTSAASSTAVNNLKDDNGTTTAFDIEITTATAAAPTVADDIGSGRLQSQAFGLEFMTNRDGMLVDNATPGTITLKQLNSGQTYTIRVYVAASNNAFASKAEATMTCNSQTKTQYADLNNTYYLEWIGVPESSGNIAITSITTTSTRSYYIQGISFKQE